MEALLIVLVLLSMFIFPVIGAAIADDRGYHACLGAAIGFFGGILGILIMLVLPKQARPPGPPRPSMPFLLLAAGLAPFVFGLVGVRWYVAWPPGLLAFAVSAVMYMVAEMSGQDPRWWGMMIVVMGPTFFWLGLLPFLLFLLGREARRGVDWGREQWQARRGRVVERNN